MRILRVHNQYRERGGEDVSFESEVRLLRDHGQDIHTLIVSNDAIPDDRSPVQSARLAAATIWSTAGKHAVEEAILDFAPDVVHFNNTFPLISPSAYAACREHGVPVVQTLHNYRYLCPNAIFFNDGHVCEDCLGKLLQYPGILRGCYRNSRAQTATVAAMNATHRLRGTWEKDVDRYVAMTRFERDKFIEGGFPASKIAVKPHFVYDTTAPRDEQRTGLLYVGRLTPDKGIQMLLDAWGGMDSIPLTIAGDGPLADAVRRLASEHPQIHFVGQESNVEVHELMRHAMLLIVTSEWYETFCRVVVEAYAERTSVLVPSIGAVGELVTENETGLHFAPGDATDLSAKLRWAVEHPEELRRMGDNARQEYEEKYTPERNYTMLMDIYRQVIEESAGRNQKAGKAHSIGASGWKETR